MSDQHKIIDPSENQLNGNRSLPFDRDVLGRMVREAWVRWAETQPNPKPSWLVPYEELDEPDKEADRQIGETIARWTLAGDAARFSMLTEHVPEGKFSRNLVEPQALTENGETDAQPRYTTKRLQDEIARARLQGKLEAIEELERKAIGQRTYFDQKQMSLPGFEDYMNEGGALTLPDDIGPLLAGRETNGRFSEADWWLGTIQALKIEIFSHNHQPCENRE